MSIDNELPLRADTVDVVYAIMPELQLRCLDTMIAQLTAARPDDRRARSRIRSRLRRLLERRAKILGTGSSGAG